MRSQPAIVLLFLGLSIVLAAAADWKILSYINNKEINIPNDNNNADKLDFNVENYCESWRFSAEVNNMQGFEVVPGECVEYIGNYMTSEQYKVDFHIVAEQVVFYLTDNFYLSGDGKDAWIFDIDDVLLSTVPFYSKFSFGGSVVDKAKFEKWASKAKAPAVAPMPLLFHHIRRLGLKVIIISSRSEKLRQATVENLFAAGYHGWTSLILRCPEDDYPTEEQYKAKQRGKLVEDGYRLWGIVGSQWSSLGGYGSARRTFKLPNPMYYQY